MSPAFAIILFARDVGKLGFPAVRVINLAGEFGEQADPAFHIISFTVEVIAELLPPQIEVFASILVLVSVPASFAH